MNNTQLQQIKSLLERAKRIIAITMVISDTGAGRNMQSKWLDEVQPVLEALGAENLQNVPEGFELREGAYRNEICEQAPCNASWLKDNNGCSCLKPIAQPSERGAQPEQVAPPLNSSGLAKEENNGSKIPVCPWSKDGSHTFIVFFGESVCVNKRMDGFSECGFNKTKWLAEHHPAPPKDREYDRFGKTQPPPKSEQECTIKDTSGLRLSNLENVRMKDLEIDYRNCQASNAKLEKEMEAMKGGGLAASWRGRIRSLENQMVAMDKEIANLRGTTEANVKVLQEYVGKSKMLNDLRKEVNELLAEKNSYVQRFEKIEKDLKKLDSLTYNGRPIGYITSNPGEPIKFQPTGDVKELIIHSARILLNSLGYLSYTNKDVEGRLKKLGIL